MTAIRASASAAWFTGVDGVRGDKGATGKIVTPGLQPATRGSPELPT
jgi:hypothetical protein